MKEVGYVYILTNPSFREDWVKIGKSSRPVDIRSKELDNTAVPLPFEIFATLKTVKYHQVERLVHKTIDRLTDLRIRQNREFFNIEPHVALDILRDIALTIDDAEITVYRNNVPVVEEEAAVVAPAQTVPTKPRRKRFKFSMIGASIGEDVVFEPTGTAVKIASDRVRGTALQALSVYRNLPPRSTEIQVGGVLRSGLLLVQRKEFA